MRLVVTTVLYSIPTFMGRHHQFLMAAFNIQGV